MKTPDWRATQTKNARLAGFTNQKRPTGGLHKPKTPDWRAFWDTFGWKCPPMLGFYFSSSIPSASNTRFTVGRENTRSACFVQTGYWAFMSMPSRLPQR